MSLEMAIDANKRKRRQRQSEAFNASIGSTHLEAIIKTTELHAIEPTPFGATTHPSFREAFWFWLKLGLIGFGGPTGQIAIMQTESASAPSMSEFLR